MASRYCVCAEGNASPGSYFHTCVDRDLLQVKYTWSASTSQTESQHGNQYGTATVLDLDDDEFITGVEGYSSASYVTQLTFITNKSLLSPSIPNSAWTYAGGRLGKSNPHGVHSGEPFQWGDIGTHRGTHVSRVRLLAFSGAV